MGRLIVDLALAGAVLVCVGLAWDAWRHEKQRDYLTAAGLVVIALLALGLLLSRARL